MRVVFLGTGTSRGVPVVGCACSVCRSTDPRNKRLRSSLLLESQVRVVIDTSVDFRSQMLREDVPELDGVVLTHHHVDHILGLDDLFPFTARGREGIPVYGDERTLEEVRQTFRHMFREPRHPGIPKVDLRKIEGPFVIGDIRFEPVTVLHGRLPVLAFRVNDFAYVTDVSEIPEESASRLRQLKVLALDGLRYRHHPTHFSIQEATAAAQALEAEMTYLTHVSHEVDHQDGCTRLPEGITLAYDGLALEI